MVVKKHPTVIEGENDISRKKSLIPFLRNLKQRCFDDSMDRTDWEEKMEHFYHVRYGFLEEEITWPWPGAADISFPMSDMVIDRVKPGMLGLANNVTPIVNFRELIGAQYRNQARNNEYLMDYLLKVRDKQFVPNFGYCLDDVLWMGWGVLHSFYEYKTELQRMVIHKDKLPPPLSNFVVIQGNEFEADFVSQISGRQIRPITKREFDQNLQLVRMMVEEAWNLHSEDPVDKKAIDSIMKFLRNGDDYVDVVVRTEVSNTARIVRLDPFDIWVPSYTRHIQSAKRINIRLTMTGEEMWRRVRDENWNERAVDQLINSSKNRMEPQGNYGRKSPMVFRNIDEIRHEREGLTSYRSDEVFEFFLTYTWLPISSEKEYERGQILWHENIEEPLKAGPLPYNHGQFPVSQIRFEMNDDRFYSPRGIPEKIADLEEELNWQEREKLNNMRIANSPTFAYEEGSNFNPGDLPWTPGQWIKVKRADGITQLSAPDRSISYERESAILRNFIEQYVGSPDLALTSIQNQSQDPRTAREIDLISQVSQVVLGFHSQIVQLGMAEVYQQAWSNWLQWGPSKFTVRVIGENPIPMTKADIMGAFEIVPRGTAGNVNPAIESRKAAERVGFLAQMKPIIDSDPNFQFRLNLVEAIKDWLEKDDYMLSKRLLEPIPEQERAAMIQQRQQQQMMAEAVANNAAPVPVSQLKQQLASLKAKAPAGGNQLVSL